MVDATIIELITAIFTVLTVISATIAAFLSYHSIRKNIDSIKSQVLLQCLREYINIRKDRTDARLKKSEELCSNYYSELFDLHWTEFRLWRLNYIEDAIMATWLKSRNRNYLNDFLIAENEKGETVEIHYKDMWNNVLIEDYFEIDDPFVKFMKLAYENKIQEALKMKQEAD
ncbi:MAG: hypothetical protein GQ533_01975 [Methanosarcinaceae archaeon]|nr:hypothetical protein [Methanosarcinaceae archaeon]